MRGAALHDKLVLAIAAVVLAAHLAWLPGHLEDIDSINFALGLHQYDIAAHQPHPPGYPVYTLAARGAEAIVPEPVSAPHETRDARAMAILSALAAAIAIVALHRLLRAAMPERVAESEAALPLLVTALTAASPLFWISASRPLSDMAGLAGALCAQALLVSAVRAGLPVRATLLAAAACGVTAGIRSQVTWLVVPLLCWVIARAWRRGDVRLAVGTALSAWGGVMTWAVPMVLLTGGLGAYRVALGAQAGDDFEGVPMLALHPGLRRLVRALADTFVEPWGWWPLAAPMLVLAVAGFTAFRGRGRLAAWIGLGFGPYLVYHLLFHETETTRYALPMMPAVAALVVLALARWTRAWRALATTACLAALAVSLQAQRQYLTTGDSVGEVLGVMDREARQSGRTPQVIMHRRVWAETRRARAAILSAAAFDVLPSPRSHEWREAVPAWQQGRPVWWLVDPRRGDRAAVDPRAMTLRERVEWPLPVASLLGGMRPHPFDWYEVDRPQWVLLDGWHVTPELAGLSAAAGQGPSTTGASALLRAGDGAVTLLVGGRHVGPAGAAPASLHVTVGSWTQQALVPVGPFAYTWTIPPGELAGHGYRTMAVIADGARGGPESILLEQFDAQRQGTPVIALESGWYEPERDVETGRMWRWVADESRLRLAGVIGRVRLDVEGTYPRHYGEAPVLEILADGRSIGTHRLSRPFRVTQVVDVGQLGPEGRLTWRVSRSFEAGARTGSADARRLSLEIATLGAHAVR